MPYPTIDERLQFSIFTNQFGFIRCIDACLNACELSKESVRIDSICIAPNEPENNRGLAGNCGGFTKEKILISKFHDETHREL